MWNEHNSKETEDTTSFLSVTLQEISFWVRHNVLVIIIAVWFSFLFFLWLEHGREEIPNYKYEFISSEIPFHCPNISLDFVKDGIVTNNEYNKFDTECDNEAKQKIISNIIKNKK